MSGTVVLIVLFGAFLHASWNAVVKSSGDKFLNAVIVVGAAGLIAAVALPFLPAPDRSSWSYLATSMVLQVIYLCLVAAAYKSGDMSQAYPIMRGTPPLLVALVSGPLIGEVLPFARWVGIGFISGGVLALAFEARRRAAIGSGRTTMLALVNAMFIAAYTLVDGIGVRKSGAPAAYTMWVFVLNALPLVIWTLAMHRDRILPHLRGRLHLAFIGGVGTLGSYGLALWAMTMAPIAVVSALRETSILFAIVISAIFLKERIGFQRIVAAVLIVIGVVIIRLS
ncbi:DMT family transporter [Phyllobacterium leguminum]|uniref:Putative membrane protein n=1 Tax=Phyllobacterium leguminum TaxID=314237 RepID=A0A318T0L6_9HYPH|nr:DMT family transporter [Phyllobacterium leguminum]PYE87224.1 putative membrane protein [Phyllobacterium leguminum]